MGNEIQKERDVTMVWTAHRLSTLIKTDKIFVLDGGVLKEQGTHRELVEMNGVYTNLWDKFLQNDKEDRVKEGAGNIINEKDNDFESLMKKAGCCGGKCK